MGVGVLDLDLVCANQKFNVLLAKSPPQPLGGKSAINASIDERGAADVSAHRRVDEVCDVASRLQRVALHEHIASKRRWRS